MGAEGELVVPNEVKSCYHPSGFLNEQQMADAYAVADIIVTRAGAGSIFELAALGKPSILIPLPESAQNHQYKNAYNYARAGATLVVEQANVTPHFILERIKYLFAHPEEYKRMSEAAFAFARPKAAKIIAEYIFAFLVY